MSDSAEGWRNLLIAISFVNTVAWSFAAMLLWRGRPERGDAMAFALRRTLLWLSAGYVLGCAYRSWWPVYDIPRVVMVDSWMSSVIVGRSVATLAELCLVTQCALLLHAAGRAVGGPLAQRVARALVPAALVAESCSWYAVLSTSNLGHVLEEALWGLGAAAWALALLSLWARWPARSRMLLALCAGAALGYVLFMFGVDVPMYWSRWRADLAAGRATLGLAAGLVDVASRWTVSTSWLHWRDEVAWMTLYFSVAVWASIALVHLPLPRVRAPARVKSGSAD